MSDKLNIAFLWHMHQPYYRDPVTGKYILPWVRLHAMKGYTDMLEAVQRFGEPKVTFNLVPCLIEQINDLATGRETDSYFDLSMKPAADISRSEQDLITTHFFSTNPETMIMPYPRYRELYLRRKRRGSRSYLDTKVKPFSNQEFCDLQVWFNLTWFGWAAEESHPVIGELKRKGRDYSEDDKKQVLQIQLEVLKDVLPAYKNAWNEGVIDISTTPFYHPILPLLVDNRVAKISQPQDLLPAETFSHPEDAQQQLKAGREYVHEILGSEPRGLWPSEGSVSSAACEMAGEAGFDWLATDERILLATLSGKNREEILYHGYNSSDTGPAIFFRDQYLSDAIGFRYASNPSDVAVDDFMGHLENIAKSQKNPGKKVVAIILDGENAWEYFKDGGRDFLNLLYSRLAEHPRLRTCTFSEFLQENPPKRVLPDVFPASWIDGSFRIWIGDKVKNQAWDILTQTAADLQNASDKVETETALKEAKNYLYRAEGSDWFWWYGEPNQSIFKPEFDQLFRLNLMQVYRELGLDVPESLLTPIGSYVTESEPGILFTIYPTIDGRETSYYEWIGAREIRSADYAGAMNLTSGLIEKLHYGISTTCLFLRVNVSDRFYEEDNLHLIVHFKTDNPGMIDISGFGEMNLNVEQSGKKSTKGDLKAAFGQILEVKIPIDVAQTDHDQIKFAVALLQNKLEVERWPRDGWYSCPWPASDYLTENWLL
jgi:alpha-amylase/alpha-mannosidase (GH57 family)